MAASGRDKETLLSYQIEVAARYCFGIPPKFEIVKSNFFLDHSVAI